MYYNDVGFLTKVVVYALKDVFFKESAVMEFVTGVAAIFSKTVLIVLRQTLLMN
jgi:hypothetical protein